MGTININISEDTNIPSTGGYLSININSKSTKIFSDEDFSLNTTPAYNNDKGYSFSGIQITSLPDKGVLQNNFNPVQVGDFITQNNLSSGMLRYVSLQDDDDGYSDSGATFKVRNSQLLYSAISYPLLINVGSSINLSPTIGSGEADINLGSTFVFTRATLTSGLNPAYFDPENDLPDELLILSLPTYGELRLDGIPVSVGDKISFDNDIDNNLFTYVNEEIPTGELEGFEFKISDKGSGQFKG